MATFIFCDNQKDRINWVIVPIPKTYEVRTVIDSLNLGRSFSLLGVINTESSPISILLGSAASGSWELRLA